MLNERRKNIVVPVVLLLGIFIGGVVVLRTQGIGAQVLTEGKKMLFPIASEPDADADNDGLKNWEEEVYKTDPRNPDTDGDGYLDGEEVASGYNPAIPAPNDALEGTDASTPRQAPKNLTAYLAQILSQKISSGEIAPAKGASLEDVKSDPNFLYNQDIFSEALAQVGQRAKDYFTAPQIKNEGIKISANDSRAAAIIYLSQINIILKDHIAEIKNLPVGEVRAIKEAVDSQNTVAVSKYATEYQSVADEIKNIEVPYPMAAWHKDMIANISLLAHIFTAIADFQNDPAMAAAALESYAPTIETLQKLSEQTPPYAAAQ